MIQGKKVMAEEIYFPSASKYYALEGIVGSGKSTCLSEFGYHTDVYSVSEPLHLFQTFKTYNPLALQYMDPVKNLVAAQLHIIRMSAVHYRAEIKAEGSLWQDKIVLSERSILSPIVFINANYKRGLLSEFTRDYLLQEYSDESAGVRKPDAIIFLSADPSVCMGRVQSRQREGEESCTLQFQEHLLSAHLDMFCTLDIPVHTVFIDCDTTKKDVFRQIRCILDEKNLAEGLWFGDINKNEDWPIFCKDEKLDG